MDVEDVVGLLGELGLTAYQSRAYLAAVRLGTARPTDIADDADVPQARVYDVVDDLAELGFVEVHEQSGGKVVSAPPPEIVLESVMQDHISEYTETVDALVTELEDYYEDTIRTDEFVTVVGLPESATRHARQAVDAAEYAVGIAAGSAVYADLRPAIEAALDRGVTVRLLLPAAESGDEADDASDDRDTATADDFPAGLAVRRRHLGDFVAVADREYGVYGDPTPFASDRDFVVARGPTLTALFQDRFERLWWGGTDVRAPSTFPRRYLDPWRAVLDLGADLADAALTAEVTGIDRRTGRRGTWTGRVVDAALVTPADAPAAALPERATLTLAEDSARVVVGGRHDPDVDVLASGLVVERTDAG